MNLILKKYLPFTLVAVALSLAYTNCSALQAPELDEENGSNVLSTEPPVDSNDDRLVGQALYSKNCALCHNALESSTKLNRTQDQISAAIMDQGAMKFLSFLSGDDIRKIAIALSPLPETPDDPPQSDSIASFIDVKIGNRYFVQSNLQEVFVSDANLDGSDNAILAVLQENVNNHPEAFGGSCTRYDGTDCTKVCGLGPGSNPCEDALVVRVQAQAIPTANALRKGFSTRTCEEILAIDKSVNTALTKAELKLETDAIPAVTEARIISFLDFYYMNRPVSANAVSSLVSLAAQAQSKGMNNLDQWRYVILPICSSAAGDLL